MTVLITGATGTVGSEFVRLCASVEDVSFRALVRDVEKATRVSALGVAPVIGLYEDRASLQAALDGVQTVVLITPAGPDAVDQAAQVLRASQIAGVEKIVRISAIKAAVDGPTENTRAHGLTESHIVDSGISYVFLRPNLFMQNLLMVAPQIQQERRFSFAMGAGKMGMIDSRDIAACALECALSNAWDGQSFELTGPMSHGYDYVAEVLSDCLGESILYRPEDPEQIYATVVAAGWGEWMAGLARDYGRVYADNWGNFTTDAVLRITAQQPRSIRDFIRAHFCNPDSA